MVAPINDNQAAALEEALTRFIDDCLRDEHPDIEEFIAQYPECEAPLKERIQDLREIFTLFDSLVHAEDSDFKGIAITPELAGRKLANFEVEKVIGRGGMGVVYLARDTKLKRPVAIKSLPPGIFADPAAQSRFRREAEVLASLNHPNIGVIHDIIEQAEGSAYLVLEYVPGETLAERIAKGPLKLQEAFTIALQIAEAVAAAHEHDVIHRDLKPGNIKITPDGRIKVLDFGLAKPLGGESPAKPATITQPGRVMGTPAYMSPEQARGKPIDKRSDIWAFGCIMYEMLSGQAPFKGETVTDTLVNVLDSEPDWQALPQSTLANIRILLRRCLEKDPFKRLQHIGDARIEISETLAGTAGLGAAVEVAIGTTRRNKWQFRISWFLLSLMAVIAAVFTTIIIKNMSTSTTDSKPAGEFVRRFPVILPSSQELIIDIWASNVALAPDGTSFVYVAGQQDQKQLYLYDMANAFDPEPINGTEGAYNPFFSYDSESIAFFAEGKLKKVSLRSGTVLEICTAGVGSQCGSWGPDDTIFFVMIPAPGRGLYKVSSNGGPPEPVTLPDSTMRETYYWFPHVLPGGKAVLFNIVTQDKSEEWCIAVLSLNTGKWRDLNLRGSNARYVETGHIVYAGSGGRLLAAPFDIERLMVTGSPNKVIDGVVTHPAAQFCVSRNGTLIYAPIDIETVKNKTLVWINPSGAKETPLGLPAAEYDSLRISPDGQWLAVQIGTVASNTEVHVCEMTRLVLTKLTFNPSWDVRPRWSPISNRITYASMRNDPSPTIFWVLPDGSDEEQLIVPDPESFQIPSSWSSDEKYLAFVKAGDTTQFDIWVLSMEDGRESRPFVNGPYNEKKPVFHPNGGWLAYVSDETGRFEVYVRQFPSGRQKKLISTDGGNDPMWDPSGRTLYYRSGEKMMAVVIETEPHFTATHPKELFEGRYEMNEWGTSYDVADTPDGLRFLMIKPAQERSRVNQLNVILNWSQELRGLLPAR